MIGGRKPFWSDTQPERREKERRDTKLKRKRKTGGQHREGPRLSAQLQIELEVQVMDRQDFKQKDKRLSGGPRRTLVGSPKRTLKSGLEDRDRQPSKHLGEDECQTGAVPRN